VRFLPSGYITPHRVMMNKRQVQMNSTLTEGCYNPYSSFIIYHSHDTFPVLKKKEEKAFGEYMSKRKCLEEYDRIGQIMNAE